MARQNDVEELQRRVGRRISELRRGHHLTQEVFAEALSVSVRYIQNVEQGRENLTLASLVRFAERLAVTPIDLLAAPSESPPPKRPSKGS